MQKDEVDGRGQGSKREGMNLSWALSVVDIGMSRRASILTSLRIMPEITVLRPRNGILSSRALHWNNL